MNLEELEQRTLHYLKQVSNPLVRVDTLHHYLAQFPAMRDLNLRDLTAFLRYHELFKVLEPPGLETDSELSKNLAEHGFLASPCVMLETRIPTQLQLTAMMIEQVDALLAALTAALREARERGDESHGKEIYATLQRAQALREELQLHEGKVAGTEDDT